VTGSADISGNTVRITDGMDASAINVVAFDSNQLGNINFTGKSTMQDGVGLTVLNAFNPNRGILSDELAHHFMGDSSVKLPIPFLGAFFGLAMNTTADFRNDLLLNFPTAARGLFSYPVPWRWGALNFGALRFSR
jgi:hypothetical protein